MLAIHSKKESTGILCHFQSIADERRNLVGSGDRSERIRTYNFPENRISDHRVNFKANNLDAVLNGELNELIGALLEADKAEKLSAAEA